MQRRRHLPGRRCHAPLEDGLAVIAWRSWSAERLRLERGIDSFPDTVPDSDGRSEPRCTAPREAMSPNSRVSGAMTDKRGGHWCPGDQHASRPVGKGVLESQTSSARPILLIDRTRGFSISKYMYIPDGVKDAPGVGGRRFSGSNGCVGVMPVTSNDDHGNPTSPSLVFSTRALEMPLRSWRVVRSGASDGGFWFHSQCSSVSSVREGQFMMGDEFRFGNG